jgi:hypothetical protein
MFALGAEAGRYCAGACLPLLLPSGCLLQELAVSEEIVLDDEPQYLQVYFGFSDPS